MPRCMTRTENEDFGKAIIIEYPLDEAIDWIVRNLKPEDVFTKGQLFKWADGAEYVPDYKI